MCLVKPGLYVSKKFRYLCALQQVFKIGCACSVSDKGAGAATTNAYGAQGGGSAADDRMQCKSPDLSNILQGLLSNSSTV